MTGSLLYKINMKLFLAPMEGVVDWVMRDMLTQIGGIDQCVTEFIRITNQVYPDHVFYKYCPELKTNSKTRAGVPVAVQLLGGQAEPLALNALRAVELGALGIDLNFGCPAKTVNRHDGGATLLKSCDRIFDIVSVVRKLIPRHIPVSAKIRLGFEDRSSCIEIAQAVEAAEASYLTVHCRSKTDGYKPPAYWEWIPKIKEKCKINIIANGEIWTVEDYLRCREVTGCNDFMIGRGVLSNPYLFQQIRNEAFQQIQKDSLESTWSQTQKLLPQFYEASVYYKNGDFAVARTKQWLKALSLKDLEAKTFFDEIKVLTRPEQFESKLSQLQ